VVSYNHTCILHHYGDMEPQKIRGHVVTTLTFLGHVRSSVMWSLDWQHMVSYKWSIEAILLVSYDCWYVSCQTFIHAYFHWRYIYHHFGLLWGTL